MRELSEPHWADAPEVFSLRDLVAVQDGSMGAALKALVKSFQTHVLECEVC